MQMPGAIRPLLAASALVLLGACASAPQSGTGAAQLVAEDGSTLRVPPGGYTAAFDAARDELRDAGFTLERVDSFSGIITTRPSGSAGFATPWSQDQSTGAQELGDFFHRQLRTVRITFETALAPAAAEPPADLRSQSGEMLMRIKVVVDRSYRPGWRINTTSIRYSTYCVDPDLAARAMQPVYTTARAEDPLLAARLTRRIAESGALAATP